jgi:transcriptional regulator with XRE-family HTH domain
MAVPLLSGTSIHCLSLLAPSAGIAARAGKESAINMDHTCDLTGAPLSQPIGLSAEIGGPRSDAAAPGPPADKPAPRRGLHCLADVRRRQHLSARKAARLLGTTVHKVRAQERPSSDILLSDLYRWQKILHVPVTELLEQADGGLSPPVRLRARLVRAMKTVRSIQEVVRQPSVRRLAENLAAQLVEIMPELAETVAWPVVGSRRLRGDFGQAFLRSITVCAVEGSYELPE